MADAKDRNWTLQCNDKKCGRMFQYFGRLRSNTGIRCPECGKSSQYRVADFIQHNPETRQKN
jgi:hypothetical protein